MANYQFGTEESYKILCEAGMPKHPRMRYKGGTAMIAAARLMTNESAKGISINKIHPKDARDVLTMHAMRWIVVARNEDGISLIEDLRVFDDPIDGFDEDPAVEATLNVGSSSNIRGKCDMLDTIISALRAAKEHPVSPT